MRFEFATATRIIFGPGTLKEMGPLLPELGRRALVVTGANPDRAEPLRRLLRESGMVDLVWSVAGEPRISDAAEGARFARENAIEVVVGFGGGSAVDAGKAIAALAENDGDPLDYLEVIGRGRSLANPPLPFVAVPTTSGTGAEVTRNAVLASPEHRVKVSLRSPLMLPKLAIVDPKLTFGLPASITASTGLDALTQLIEPFVSCRANPMTDGLCREGILRAARSLRRACVAPDDLAAREDMAAASLFSGLALANAGLGAVHGFAAPIGGMFDAPHGAVCAALLPHAMEMNLRALRERQLAAEVLSRYAEVACWLTGRSDAKAEDAVIWLRELCADLKIPSLGAYGIASTDVPTLCEKAAQASSMKGNPIVLNSAELQELLSRAL